MTFRPTDPTPVKEQQRKPKDPRFEDVRAVYYAGTARINKPIATFSSMKAEGWSS